MKVDSRTYFPDGQQASTQYICVPSADLMTSTGDGTAMGTQALMGQRFDVIDTTAALSRGALYSVLSGIDRVDYIGELPTSALSKAKHEPTHRVSAVAAAIFEQANIKSKLIGSLARNSLVEGQLQDDFLSLAQGGFIHTRHISTLTAPPEKSFTALAADMLSLPYIWGGTGHIGVDCSGLVQSALAATGVDAPRDTDQQEAALGRDVSYANRAQGDLLFWPGHVGIVVENDQLLHANAYHMCVALEPVWEAVARIGNVRSVKRLMSLHLT